MSPALLCLLLVSIAPAEETPKKAYIGVMIAQPEMKGDITIIGLVADAPAEKAGLKVDDVLVRIDGAKPANLQAAVKVIGALKPGKKVKFLIKRAGKEMEIDVTPG